MTEKSSPQPGPCISARPDAQRPYRPDDFCSDQRCGLLGQCARVQAPEGGELPTTEAGWLHRCDMRFAEGYAKGRAAQPALPPGVPSLADLRQRFAGVPDHSGKGAAVPAPAEGDAAPAGVIPPTDDDRCCYGGPREACGIPCFRHRASKPDVQPRSTEPVATVVEHYGFTDAIVRFETFNREQLPVGTKLYAGPVQTPAPAPDLAATLAKLRPMGYRFDAPGITKISQDPHGGAWVKLYSAEQVVSALGATSSPAVKAESDDASFEVWEGDELFAGTSGPRAQAWAELLRYAAQCEGVVRVFEVSRVERTLSYVPVHPMGGANGS